LIYRDVNGGVEWQPAGEPERVNVHDFVDPELGRAIPYGIYDETNNEGWVSVGDVADTAEFAVNAIRSWWHQMGAPRFPDATSLLITADAGGSNGYRLRAWKVHLARLAAETGLEITVCHYPPGTSKWNRIEHRMFSFITMNWRGRPLTTYRTIIELITATRPTPGFRSAPNETPSTTRRASRSATPTCELCPSPPTNGTATGTTPSPPHQPHNQSCGEP